MKPISKNSETKINKIFSIVLAVLVIAMLIINITKLYNL